MRVPRRLRRTSRASRRATRISTRASATRSCARSTAGSSRGRQQLVAEATEAYEAQLTVRRGRRLRGVRRRPLELVHPPLAAPLLRVATTRRSGRSGTRSSSRCASIAPMHAVPVRAPLAELVAARGRAGVSVHLAGWPEAAGARTRRCSTRWREVRRVVELGRQARATPRAQAAPAAAAARRRRAPARAAAHADEIRGRAAREGGRVRRRGRDASCA